MVVVGGSLAGLRAVEELRARGFGGTITVIGDEARLPYDRPPLSKQVLAGEWDLERISLEPLGGGFDDLDVAWRLGETAVALDLREREIELSYGARVHFDGLVIATGASVRRLPGQPDLAGLHMLRTVEDCLALRADLAREPSRVIVVGAGFIGAEVAATARGLGLDVTLLEALAVPLQRVLGEEIGSVMAELHRDHGVDLRVSTGVEGFLEDGNGRVAGVRLTDGSSLEAEVVVVGVGVAPNTSWLDGSGLTLDNGVVCDETCLAGPGVVAAGDVARWPSRRFGEVSRVEHWENAQEQGPHAARTLLGDAVAYDPVGWFWSDQYDRKIQLAGRTGPGDTVRVIEGSLAQRRFVALFGRAGRAVGVLGFNRPAVVMRYRQRILDGLSWEDAMTDAIER